MLVLRDFCFDSSPVHLRLREATMTRRILLVLDESVTDTECGECEHWLDLSTPTCAIYGELDDYERHPECLAAEREAERCVEIAPDDAAAFTRSAWAAWMEIPADVRERIYAAIERVAKARGGGR